MNLIKKNSRKIDNDIRWLQNIALWIVFFILLCWNETSQKLFHIFFSSKYYFIDEMTTTFKKKKQLELFLNRKII